MRKHGFVKRVIEAGGMIKPLIIPTQTGTGLLNPSVYNDNGKLMVNIRHCQYTLIHAEKHKYEHQWGPLCYLCPEDDMTLTTTNHVCRLDDDLDIMQFSKVDTSKLDVKPIWEFVGLEDGRLFRWDSKLYLCGVRRDTTPNGVGRMELSEIEYDKNGKVSEISRWRIPAPPPDNTYCEKNWMPIIDMPWHFVKWSNPTEIVKVDPVAKSCETVFLGKHTPQWGWDFRGGSHVIPWGDNGHHIAVSHVLTYFGKSEQGRKDAQYRHSFIEWDRDWNVVQYGPAFDFMGAEIEFAVGMCEYKGDYLISFGFQDNAAYILRTPKSVIEEYMHV